MSVPAIVAIETAKPMSFVGNQLMVFLDPILALFVKIKDYDRMTALLEDRENLERLITAIERMEDEKTRKKGK